MSELDGNQRPARRLWIIAAVLALGLHLGGAALALAHLKSNEGDEGLGANGAEFAVEMESPKLPDDDLPPGPESADQQASPEQVAQKADPKPSDLPQDKPMEEDNPDQIVSPDKNDKPKEDDPKIATVETQQSAAQDASEAAAPQKLDDTSRESDKMKAPNPGIGKDLLRMTTKWNRQISAYFKLHLRFPKDREKAAKVQVGVVLNRRGNVVSAEVLQSSGDPAYDEAALSMVHRSDPLPQPPAELTDDTFSFTLPVIFDKSQSK
jgi:periplasmic protein TonB